jgi:hypothetical protein
MALSESSFCFLTLLGFYFLADYLEQKKGTFLTLTLSAISIGLAFLTRYVGVTAIITSLIIITCYSENNFKKRFLDCFYFSTLSLLPMLLWMGRNRILNDTATGRHLKIHTISVEKIQGGLEVLLNCLFLPSNYAFTQSIILIVVIVTIYLITLKYLDTKYLSKFCEICFIFISIYTLFLLISISLFDAHTPLDIRILFPVYLFFILGFALLSHRVSLVKKNQYISYLLFFSLFLLSCAQFVVQKDFILRVASNGIGFAGKQWHQSDMLQWVKNLPHDTIIYTNGPDPIKIITNRHSLLLPCKVSPVDRSKNENINKELNDMIANLSTNKGVIIYLDRITWRWYLPTLEELRQEIPLKLKYKGKDGIAVTLEHKVGDFGSSGK